MQGVVVVPVCACFVYVRASVCVCVSEHTTLSTLRQVYHVCPSA